jgi:enamine deaminase RidA (YjgF/YER057c/UK114 family)
MMETDDIGGLTAAAIRASLATRHLTLPSLSTPLGAYAAALQRGGLAAMSGQFPLVDGALIHAGRVGVELTVEEGAAAAHQAALNVIAQLTALISDHWVLLGLLRLDGYVAGADDFTGQATIMDKASTLLVDVLGADIGRHARTVTGVPRLPLNAPVELALTFMVGGHPDPRQTYRV